MGRNDLCMKTSRTKLNRASSISNSSTRCYHLCKEPIIMASESLSSQLYMTRSNLIAVSQPHFSLPAPLRPVLRYLQRTFGPINFITLHYIYFITTCLVASVIFWGSSTPFRSISYTDSLFLCISAMTLAGLNTVNLSEMNTWQQIMLLILTLLGSSILVSAAVVYIRLWAFEKKFTIVVKERRNRARGSIMKAVGLSKAVGRLRSKSELKKAAEIEEKKDPQHPNGRSRSNDLGAVEETDEEHELTAFPSIDTRIIPKRMPQEETRRMSIRADGDNAEDVHSEHIAFDEPSRSPTAPLRRGRVLSFVGVGARPDLDNHPKRASPPDRPSQDLNGQPMDQSRFAPSNFFRSIMGTHSNILIGRNSQFHNMTLEERERLGGVEFKAVEALAVIVPLYFIMCQLLPCIGLGAWTAAHRASMTRENGLNPWWVGIFNGVSAFNNSGMSLLDANVVSEFSSVLTFSMINLNAISLPMNQPVPSDIHGHRACSSTQWPQ